MVKPRQELLGNITDLDKYATGIVDGYGANIKNISACTINGSASAPTVAAGAGAFWVDQDNPSHPKFTDGFGNTTTLGSGGGGASDLSTVLGIGNTTGNNWIVVQNNLGLQTSSGSGTRENINITGGGGDTGGSVYVSGGAGTTGGSLYLNAGGGTTIGNVNLQISGSTICYTGMPNAGGGGAIDTQVGFVVNQPLFVKSPILANTNGNLELFTPDTGNVTIETSLYLTTGTSGNISLLTGSGNLSQTGSVSIETGSSSSGPAGNISLNAGTGIPGGYGGGGGGFISLSAPGNYIQLVASSSFGYVQLVSNSSYVQLTGNGGTAYLGTMDNIFSSTGYTSTIPALISQSPLIVMAPIFAPNGGSGINIFTPDSSSVTIETGYQANAAGTGSGNISVQTNSVSTSAMTSGNVTIQTGSTQNGTVGSITIQTGASATSATPGDVSITAGGTYTSGNVSISTNSASSGSGTISLTVGSTNGVGGSVTLTAGTGVSNGGPVTITSGSSSGGGAGGVSITSGSGTGGAAAGGDITLTAGSSSTALPGNISLQTNAGTGGIYGYITTNTYLKIGNRTPPASAPSGGGYLYSDAGAGKWRGTSGTTTTFGTAEPHCPRCGRDFANEWENSITKEKLSICMPCLVGALLKVGISHEEFTIKYEMNEAV